MEFYWSLTQPHSQYPRLDSPVWVAWHRVLLPNVVSSSNHPLDPGQYFFLQALDVDLYIKFKDMWEDEWKHNINIVYDHLKHHDVD